MGILCSHCKVNWSMHYHSPVFKCGSADHCHLGWLFLLLSDILPITVVFVIILRFNIPLTSGSMNGFIFYAQVINFFQLTVHNRILYPKRLVAVINIIGTLYKMFKLQFFYHDALSFFLKRNANILDLLTLQYVGLLYSFILLLMITLTLRVCNIRVVKLLFRCRVHTIQASIIHGITAYVMLCFVQCASISSSMLSYGHILGQDHEVVKKVVFFDAHLDWLGPGHLVYAVPSIVVGFVVVFIPMVTLLLYPNCYKFLAILKIPETMYSRSICRMLPLDKLKPLLDSFQGCFKDNCRCFAGLYLLYRVLIVLNMYVISTDNFYVTLEIQLILMLLLHAVIQPYKKRRLTFSCLPICQSSMQ